MKDLFKKFAYTSCFMFGVVSTLLAIPVGYISRELTWGTPIQNLDSQNHTATLRRLFGIVDYNLVIEVDGQRIYHSGDIWGISEQQLRAALIWDKMGRVVVFEKMGEIVFAYDAQEKRTISANEAKSYCLSPMPASYNFEFPNSCKEK